MPLANHGTMPDNHPFMNAQLFTFNNQRLFSDHYLNERVPELTEFATTQNLPFAEAQALWAGYSAKRKSGEKEGETEDNWIRPIFQLLNHHYKPIPSLHTPQGTKEPDYVLFADDAAIQRLPAGTLSESDLTEATAIAEAKRWDRPLDQTAGKKNGLSNNPTLQTDFYMRHSGATWGILTNGRKWRLYHTDTSKYLDRYYEVDLPLLLETGDAEQFRYFYQFFDSRAITSGFLEKVLVKSRDYEQGVGRNLKEQVYDALRELAQGFLDFPANGFQADTLTPDELTAIYDNSLIVLYRILFALYAESRDLLPLKSNAAYRTGYSFDALRHKVASDLRGGVGAVATMSSLWNRLRDLWQIIDEGNPALDVPTYNGGLFKPDAHPFLEQYRVGDVALRQAIDLLARVANPETGRREFVDYRDLDVRHLGSIYEGLLEYKFRVASRGG